MSQLIDDLRTRAQIRRQIDTRKSVQEGKPDRIADLLESAADMLMRADRQLAAARKWYDKENPAEDGHDQVYPWDYA